MGGSAAAARRPGVDAPRVGRLVHDARLADDAVLRAPARQQRGREAEEHQRLEHHAVGLALEVLGDDHLKEEVVEEEV